METSKYVQNAQLLSPAVLFTHSVPDTHEHRSPMDSRYVGSQFSTFCAVPPVSRLLTVLMNTLDSLKTEVPGGLGVEGTQPQRS